MLQKLPAAALAIHARQHTGICRRIDHDIRRRQCIQIRGRAQIGMVDLDPQFPQGGTIHLRAFAHEIIKTKNFPGRFGFTQPPGQPRSNKTTNTADENAHE